jgi:hypothetical protein
MCVKHRMNRTPHTNSSGNRIILFWHIPTENAGNGHHATQVRQRTFAMSEMTSFGSCFISAYSSCPLNWVARTSSSEEALRGQQVSQQFVSGIIHPFVSAAPWLASYDVHPFKLSSINDNVATVSESRTRGYVSRRFGRNLHSSSLLEWHG